MRRLLAILTATFLLASPTDIRADDTGVAQMLHDIRREGRNLCLSSHFHSGGSSGERTRKAAEAAAIKSWAGFTAWEYGTDWAQWRKAASKRMSCTEESAGSWGCQVEARPCK